MFLTFVLASVFLFIPSDSFLFPTGGGGGGGGCGCGCPPPPPPPQPCCPPPQPCCGRKRRKRFTRSLADKSNAPHQGSINLNTSILCNIPKLRDVVEKSMRESAQESLDSLKSSIDTSAFLILCSSGNIDFVAPTGSQFCGAQTTTHYCQVFSISTFEEN
ncbi:unnamed protein product [Caenorhabditis bovis]|uniref:Ground-like domain-containing protein n=1 Tax=Caenorhabditis bovis TaxID=2654633 RepID=A0A8S1EG69_9PELO|nr:unnamed protein product [Caenorhabditis bovis]